MTDNFEQLKVYYDGGCPICRFEVALYERHDKAGVIGWIDIEQLADHELPGDKTRADLLGRFHAHADGRWHIGVDAFARIWRALPIWRNFAFLFTVPGVRQLAEIGYRLFLRWQRHHRANRNSDERAIVG